MEKSLTIIIQAGGRGRRLQKYTKNCPKALISLNDYTLLERNLNVLFSVFNNSQYYVIADHKSHIISNYFRSYPHPSNPSVILPEGKGTLSGLKKCISLSESANCLFIWCDLLLDELDLKNLRTAVNASDIIGLSKSFDCRWSYSDEYLLKEESSNKRGVAGLFYFHNIKSRFQSIPNSGEFVKWLSSYNDYKPDVIFLEHTTELGDIKEYENLFVNKVSRERFFNKITFEKEVVVKECIDPDFNSLIENEVNWYTYMNRNGYSHCPEIYSSNPLTIDKIIGSHPDELDADSSILRKCTEALTSLHTIDSRPCVLDDIKSVYINKTLERVSKVDALLPISNKYLMINGKSYENPFHQDLIDEFIDSAVDLISKTNVDFVPIHGDPTFSNMLYDSEKRKVFLIDPRGKFGKTSIFGDPYYDFAKLLYSVEGSYDSFNKKNFDLTVYSDEEYYLAIPCSKFESFSDIIYDSVQSRSRLLLIHSLIWFSLCGYVKDHIESIIGSFLKGVLVYANYKKCILELSTLTKTWLLDIDGTIVEHNGHLTKGLINERLLKGVEDFISTINPEDTIILMSARNYSEIEYVLNMVKNICPSKNIRVIDSLGTGERVLINDQKPSGLKTAHAINLKRNAGIDVPLYFVNPRL